MLLASPGATYLEKPQLCLREAEGKAGNGPGEPGLEVIAETRGREGDTREGRGRVPGPVSPHPQHLSSLWHLGGGGCGGGYSVYLLGMFAGLLKNIQRLGDQGTHPKSGGTSKAEEMVATASG